jgi:transaldolase
VAPGTVNTMPEATLRAVADHGVIRGETIRSGYPGAQHTVDDLRGVGVDMSDVFRTLEADGVSRFQASWGELQADVAAALAEERDQ